MQTLVLLPSLLLSIAMLFDEFVFHRKRGLPRWERIGHPIDTLSVLLSFAIVLIMPFSNQSLMYFILVSLASCLLVTKDEFVHAEKCEPKEQWLHAVLFFLHPLQFVAAAVLWSVRDKVATTLGIEATFADLFLKSQALLLSLFCFYQLVYWNVLAKNKN